MVAPRTAIYWTSAILTTLFTTTTIHKGVENGTTTNPEEFFDEDDREFFAFKEPEDVGTSPNSTANEVVDVCAAIISLVIGSPALEKTPLTTILCDKLLSTEIMLPIPKRFLVLAFALALAFACLVEFRLPVQNYQDLMVKAALNRGLVWTSWALLGILAGPRNFVLVYTCVAIADGRLVIASAIMALWALIKCLI